MATIFKDKELEAYSRVMTAPQTAETGFTLRTAVCAFLIGLFMMPGAMYLNLVVGVGLGDAGRWVAVILFMEVLRRTRATIRSQELFILFMMAGLMMSSPFSGLLWNQYMVQSPILQGMQYTDKIPSWVAPPATSTSYADRTFFHKDWLAPIGIIVFGLFVSRIEQFGLGLALYYMTAKVEQLPFPMAPVGAAGTIALAEKPEEKGAWKWKAFSIGASIGVVWGAVYMALPIVSELFFNSRYQIFPIPWLETTDITGQWSWLKAVPTGLVMDLGLFMIGLVIPFWAAVGSLFGVVFSMILNPILYKFGVLHTFQPGMDTVQTQISNYVDFYFSYGLGVTISIAAIGLFQALWMVLRTRQERRRQKEMQVGDGTTYMQRLKQYKGGVALGLGIYAFTTIAWITLVINLVPTFPLAFLLLYGVLYVPLLSYVSARLHGMIGRGIQIPFVREATLILSGIKGLPVWFVPLGGLMTAEDGGALSFRQMELTGTKFRSQIMATFTALPIIVIFSLLASQMIWKMGQVPSESFPFAEKLWPMQVLQSTVLWSSTMGGESQFRNAWNTNYLLTGLGSGVILAAVLSLMSLPTNLFYGIIAGLGGGMVHYFVFPFLGAMFARFILWKKFGKDNWLRFAPVVVAGFTCGFGLIGMLAFGLVLINKTVSSLPW